MLPDEQAVFKARLSGANHSVKLYIALLMLIGCLIADNPVCSAVIAAAMITAGLYGSGLRPGRYLRRLLVPCGFIFIGVLTVALTILPPSADISSATIPATASAVGETTQWLLNWRLGGWQIGFTMGGLATAANLFLKSLGCIASLYFLVLTTPVTVLVGKLYKLPLPRVFVEIMLLTYRFISDLLGVASQMHTAQNARLSRISIRTALKSTGILASTLFVRAYRRSNSNFLAMEARGYDGTIPYVAIPVPPARLELALCVLTTLLVLAMVLASRIPALPAGLATLLGVS